MASLIGGAETCNPETEKAPSLAGFDSVIVGSSLYVGSIRKAVKKYLANNADELEKKRVGLFLCGMEEENAETYFSSNFPGKLLEAAHAKSFFGGEYDGSKAGGFDKFLIKVAKKGASHGSKIFDQNIVSFAEKMK